MVEPNVALVELIPCAAMLYSGAGLILAVNPMFCELVGYTPDELVGRRVSDLVSSDQQQLDDAAWLTELVRKEGRIIQCEVARKCLNGNGALQCLALMRKFTPPSDSEERFRKFADAIPQIVWSARPDGFHDYFNRQLFDYVGVDENQFKGDAWVALLHPDDVQRMTECWQHSLATGVPYQAEYRLRHRSGEYRWALARALPVRDDKGNIVSWMGTSTDIHDSMVMQAALRDTQSRLEAALTAAEIGTWTWDIQPDRVHADSNLAAMFGVAPDVADGGPIDAYLALVHPEDVGAVRAGIEQSVASGLPYSERFRIRPLAGKVRFVQSRGVVTTDNAGKPLRMSGAVLDITRQQLAEEALKSSELTFRTLADNIPQLAWMADSDGYIFWYNNRWFEYTGSTLEEMQGWGWSKVHHPDHLERVLALYRKQIVEEQCVWDDTFPLRGADGQYRWFLSRAVPIRDEHGKWCAGWAPTRTSLCSARPTSARTISSRSWLTSCAIRWRQSVLLPSF